MTECESLRVVFAGTPEFAVPPLQALVDSGHSVVAVYTQPDKPAGRGRKVSLSAVKQCALELELDCYQPESFRDPAAVIELAALEPDIMVVVAYGQILPQQVLSIPRVGCLNIHGSLLPRWRGAAPIHRAILAGDSTTGVSIMQMEEGLDTGPVLLSRSVAIGHDTNTQQLHDTLSALGAQCLVEAIEGWCNGNINAQVQAEEQANYAHKIQKSEALIDWHHEAINVDRQIRAFNPWPVAETTLDGRKLRVWQAELPAQDYVSDSSGLAGNAPGRPDRPPGTVLRCDQAGVEVLCGSGTLLLTTLQLPGKKPVSARDFSNSQSPTGKILGAATVASGESH